MILNELRTLLEIGETFCSFKVETQYFFLLHVKQAPLIN